MNNTNNASYRSTQLDDESAEDINMDNGVNHFVKTLYEDLEAIMAPKRRMPLFEEILQHLRDITTKMKRNIKREQVKEEWQMLAKVIDRFLLVIFLLVITGLTVSILYLYPKIALPAHVQ